VPPLDDVGAHCGEDARAVAGVGRHRALAEARGVVVLRGGLFAAEHELLAAGPVRRPCSLRRGPGVRGGLCAQVGRTAAPCDRCASQHEKGQNPWSHRTSIPPRLGCCVGSASRRREGRPRARSALRRLRKRQRALRGRPRERAASPVRGGYALPDSHRCARALRWTRPGRRPTSATPHRRCPVHLRSLRAVRVCGHHGTRRRNPWASTTG
jgi:hypothetical protein